MARFKRYILWRRAALPLSALATLTPEGTWALLDEDHRMREERQAIAGELSDRIYLKVPTLDGPLRRRVLRARRDLHNDRLPPPQDLAAFRCTLNDPEREALRRWHASRIDAERRQLEVAARFTDELVEARRQLAAIATSEEF